MLSNKGKKKSIGSKTTQNARELLLACNLYLEEFEAVICGSGVGTGRETPFTTRFCDMLSSAIRFRLRLNFNPAPAPLSENVELLEEVSC